MASILIKVNDISLKAKESQTILEICHENKINIPSFCHLDCPKTIGNCRICVVEIKGREHLHPACSTKVADGMEIYTHTDRVKRARKTIMELLLANHFEDCLVCLKNGECEIQELAKEFGIRERRYIGARRKSPIDLSSRAIERDPNKCVLCGRCIEVCNAKQNVGALNYLNTGFKTGVGPASGELSASECVYCGQCILVCPTGALRERSALKNVWTAIHDPGKKVAAIISPSAKFSFFDSETPEELDDLIAGSLRTLGFDYVFDMSLANAHYLKDLLTELKKRYNDKGLLPLIPTFCPAVVLLVEKKYPHLIPYLQDSKSPGKLAGSLIKTGFAPSVNLSARDLFVVEIKPCTAAKDEATKDDFRQEGYHDIDAVLTTRELERMFMTSGVEKQYLKKSRFDKPFVNHYPGLGFLEIAGGLQDFLKCLDPGYKIIAADNLKDVGSLLNDFAKLSDISLLELFACPLGCIGGGGSNAGCILDLENRKSKITSLQMNSPSNMDFNKGMEKFKAKLSGDR